MFERIKMLGSSIVGLISGVLFGIVIISLYLIFSSNLNIIYFTIPVIISIIAAVSFFLPNFVRVPYSISGFISGILLVITAFSIFLLFFKENIFFIIVEIFLVVIAFLSTFLLMLTMEIRRGIKKEKGSEEKTREIKPPYERL